MTPPERPLPVHARPGSRTGDNPGDDRGGDGAGELLWWALRAVNVHDLVIFPVRSGGKTPAVRGWQHVATQDRAQLRRWFREQRDNQQRCNIGIATGPSGLLVIDLDDGHGHTPPPVSAENPVTVPEQHLPARHPDISVPKRTSMIA